MERYLKKIAIATTIYLLSLGTSSSSTQAGTLLTGKYGYLNNNINPVQLKSLYPDIINLSSGNKFIAPNNTKKTPVNLLSNQNIDASDIQDLSVDLSKKLDSLGSTEQLNKQIQDYYQVFLDEKTHLTSEEAKTVLAKELARLPNAEQINQDIQTRYQGVIEEDEEMMSMLAARKLLLSEDNVIGAEVAKGANVNVDETLAMLQAQGFLDELPSAEKEVITFPLPLLIGFFLIIASILAPVFITIGKVLEEEVVEGLQEKYGNPKVPERAATLHNKTFRELKTLANRASKIADQKFGSEEFIVYIKLKKQVEQGVNEYKTIGQSIKYLEVAIAAQSSFLKLESTELRFRSRKQQEFYNFVIDTISDDLDKDVFRDKVKKKLAQIIPLLNSEEGRNALQSYLKEVNEISKHDLGLKIFSLFKKYQLDDFTILRTISDITQQLEAQDLFKLEGLTVLVLENYNVFEKLGPIIGVSEEENSPETYAKMMQYMGLVNRNSKAYQEFELLLKTLKKWEKPYNSLKLIREQYSPNEYRLPAQFSTELPGVTLYEKYKKHLNSDQ